jgi:hypothetical protein
VAGSWRKSETLEERFLKHVVKTDTCWIWKGCISVHGYGLLGYKMRRKFAHRIAYELFNGPIENGLYVCHSCDNTKCVNPAHLFLGDQKVNMADCASKGRIARGSRSGTAKLTDEQVLEIHEIFKREKITHLKLGERFGVSRSAIGAILNGKRWTAFAVKGA